MIHLISLAAYVAATAFACAVFGTSAAKWILVTMAAIIIVSIPIGILSRNNATPRGRAVWLGPINLINSNNRQWCVWTVILIVTICHSLNYGLGSIQLDNPLAAEQQSFDNDPTVQNARRQADKLYQEMYRYSPTEKVTTWATPKPVPPPAEPIKIKSWKPLGLAMYCFLIWLIMIPLTFIDEVLATVDRAYARMGIDRGGSARTHRSNRQSWLGRVWSGAPSVATETATPAVAAATTAATTSTSTSSVFRDSLMANVIVELPEMILSILRATRHATNN